MKNSSAPLATLTLATLLATLATGAHAQTQWGVSISLPSTPINVPALPVHAQPAPQPFPAPTYAPDPQPVAPIAPAAPQPPSIEQLQAQQHARIQWGWRAGLISHRELRHLQSLQSHLEQQRYWAYADGWLTADEQQSLYGALNNLSIRVEHSLNYGQPYGYVPQHYTVAPLPLFLWNFSWWQRPPHQSHGHAQQPNVHQHHHTAPRPPTVAVIAPRPPHQALPRPFDPHRPPPK